MKAGVHPVTSAVVAAAIMAFLSWSPSITAQRGQGGGRQGGAAVQDGQRGGGQGRGARGGRGQANQEPAGPTPRLPNGKPDLSGHWTNPYTPNMAGRGVLDPKTRQPLKFARQGERLNVPDYPERTYDLPYTDWGLEQWIAYDPVKNGDYAGNCLPFGMSRNINSPHGVQIVQNNDSIAFLFEQNTWHHWVPTNPQFQWPDDLPEAWSGYSTGRWDGDTLIIETKNFNGYTRLDTNGHPHSREMTLINTFLRTDSQTIEHTVTVRDPRAYTQEWMNVRTWRLKQPDDVLMEYSCEENNLQNLIDGSIKLWTPPEDIE